MTTRRVDDIIKRAISDAQKEIPSEEITQIEMMENLAHTKRLEDKKQKKPE